MVYYIENMVPARSMRPGGSVRTENTEVHQGWAAYPLLPVHICLAPTQAYLFI
jgi:hypothetical protein